MSDNKRKAMTPTPPQAEPTMFLCNPKCDHDFSGWVDVKDENGNVRGGTQVCSKCGRTAMSVSLWEGL